VKIVIDTNVFVSSFLNSAGIPRRIIDLWKKGDLDLCLCAEILSEYLEVLSRMGLSGEPELKELLTLFKGRRHITFVVIENDLEVVEADPADNKFIESAVKAKAAAVISGDKHLKQLGKFEGIPILSPAAFISFMEGQTGK
jgi:putative PIN family toxin of toxin-antitoxin system